MKKLMFFILVSFPLYSSVEWGSGIQFDHLTSKDGAPGQAIWDMLQDSRGFMWFATLGGLYRYDGYQFKSIGSDQGLNSLRYIHEDRQGRLWIGSFSTGLSLYNPRFETFKSFRYNPKDPNSLSGDQIRCITETKDGTLWIGTFNGLNEMDPATYKITRYTQSDLPGRLGDNRINDLVEDPDGNLWIGTFGGGLFKLDRQTGTFSHYPSDPNNTHSISNNLVTKLLLDTEGLLWIGTQTGLDCMNLKTGKITHYYHDPKDPNSLANNYAHALYEAENNIWVGHRGAGLSVFDKKIQAFRRYLNRKGDNRSLLRNEVISFTQSREGILWIGTEGPGICQFDPRKGQFGHFRTFDKPNSLSGSQVRSIRESAPDKVWIGHENGLDLFNPHTGNFKNIPTQEYGLPAGPIRTIEIDHRGNLWLGIFGFGLAKFNPESKEVRTYPSGAGNPEALADSSVTAIVEDGSHNIWVGSYQALNLLNPETGKVKQFKNDPTDQSSLGSVPIMCLLEDRSRELWIGSFGGGLHKYEPRTQRFIRYTNTPSDEQSLSNNSISTIFEDRQGHLWIGTYGGGFNRFNRGNNNFTYFTTKDGLVDNNVVAICQENDSTSLWMSTHNGISQFDQETETFHSYNLNDGLQGEMFYQTSHVTQTGEIFFGGANGFNMFHPQKITPNTYSPSIAFSDFQIGFKPVPIGSELLPQSIDYLSELTLTSKERFLSLSFAALNFREPEKNRYRYRILGIEDDWVEVDSQKRYFTLTKPTPGDYWFHVKGSNNHEVWSEKGRVIHIKILPLWWQKTWVRILFVFMLAITLTLIHWMRTKTLQERSLLLEARVNERTAELQEVNKKLEKSNRKMEMVNKELESFSYSVSHDLRAPLRAINGFSQALIEDYADDLEPEAKSYLDRVIAASKRMGVLIDDMLTLSRITREEIKRETVDLSNMAQQIIEDLQRTQPQRNVEIIIAENITASGDAHLLRIMFENLLGNAWKYTSKTEDARIEFGISQQQEFFIRDNGAGFDMNYSQKLFAPFQRLHHVKDFEGTGIGLATVKRIIQRHGGQIWAHAAVNQGATFYFKLET